MKPRRPTLFLTPAQVAKDMYEYYEKNGITHENGVSVWEAVAQIVLEAAGIQKLLEDAAKETP